MKLVRKNVNDLIRPDFNPRIDVRNNKKFYDKLKNSLDEFGYVSPIIWNKTTGHVVGGNQRLAVLQDKGVTEIEVVEVEMDIEKEKSLNVALNKISGEWDDDKLAVLLSEIQVDNLDMFTGFDVEEIEQLMIDAGLKKIEEEKTDVDELIKKESKYNVVRGDVFQLGGHVLTCGDCTNTDDLRRLICENKMDMLLTDPPYNVNYSSKNELLNLYGKGNCIQTDIIQDDIDPIEYMSFTEKWMNNCLNFLANYNTIYIFGNYESLINHYLNKNIKISNMLVWVKNSIIIGRMDYKGQHEFILYGWKTHHKWYGPNNASTVLNINKPLANKEHPTMKPLQLLSILIFNSSKPKHNVLDPFGGSGSTLISCEKTGRNCYMMEIDPHYCSVIIERWELLTNKKHKKIKGGEN